MPGPFASRTTGPAFEPAGAVAGRPGGGECRSVPHGTSTHCVLGWTASKHPSFGVGVLAIWRRHCALACSRGGTPVSEGVSVVAPGERGSSGVEVPGEAAEHAAASASVTNEMERSRMEIMVALMGADDGVERLADERGTRSCGGAARRRCATPSATAVPGAFWAISRDHRGRSVGFHHALGTRASAFATGTNAP